MLVKGPGAYSVVAQNNCNVQFRDSLTVTRSFWTPFGLQPAAATACPGDSLQFNASGGTSYSWLPAGSFNRPDIASPKVLIRGSQNFTLTITDSVCAKDTVITIPVTAAPVARISVVKSNDITCKSDSAVLTATGGVTYTWTPDLYISANAAGKITVRPPAAITYFVVGTNSAGCSGKDSINVSYIQDADQKLIVPSAFTPDGNGTNDVFRPVFTGPAMKYSFTVYNRWGQPVFTTSSKDLGWNGTYHGTPQAQGTYIYYVTAEGACTGLFKQKGTFMLIR